MRVAISECITSVWQWLSRHARPLQALAAIAVIGGGLLSSYIYFFPKDEILTHDVCTSFETYSDNTKFEANLLFNGVIFQSHHKEGHLFVNQIGNIKILQFMDEGLTIDFPSPANAVTIKLANFHRSIRLEALGDDEIILKSITIDRDNSTELLRIRQNTFSINKIRLSGGGNEGGVESVCAQVMRLK